ncbi:MAG: hypothetical protein M0Z67_15490 [Nitrospiraceae bacterium]|nr:hypothetical protein [Nitrospiraceae bacterium]
MDKTDKNKSGTFWAAAANSTAEDLRRGVRERAIGDILWSYVADIDENCFKGTIINESESGLCLLTLAPIKVGSILRFYGEGRAAVRDATVVWCKKGPANIYQSGLLLSEL